MASSDDLTAQAWLNPDTFEKDADGRITLIGGKCPVCATKMVPYTVPCPSCANEDVVKSRMPGEGNLYTFTRVHVGASRWHLPFAIGYVDLPNGVRVFSHLRDSGKKLKVDGHVRAVTAEVGRDAEGHPLMAAVFEPAENA